jgi:hypothetical protein
MMVLGAVAAVAKRIRNGGAVVRVTTRTRFDHRPESVPLRFAPFLAKQTQ